MAEEPSLFGQLTGALPKEHQELVEEMVPESSKLAVWLNRGAIATLGAHATLIAAIYFWAHAGSKNLLLPWMLIVIPALLAKTPWQRRHLWFSPNLGPLAAVALLGLAAFASPAVTLAFYSLSIPAFGLLEGERAHNPWSTRTYYLYSSIIFSLYSEQHPSLPCAVGVFMVTIGYAVFRKRRTLLASAVGAAILIAVFALDGPEGKQLGILVLLLAGLVGAVVFEIRRRNAPVSDLAVFLGSGLAASGLLAIGYFFDEEPFIVWAITVTLLEIVLVMRDPPSVARLVWIGVSWQSVIWQKVHSLEIKPLLSLFACAALAYLGTVRSRRFVQAAAVLLSGIAAGAALSNESDFALAHLLTGIGCAVLFISAGTTYAPRSATPWWHGLIPERIFQPVVHFARVSLGQVAKAPVFSTVIAVVVLPLSWIKSGKDQPGPFTLEAVTILLGNIIGATATARQLAFFLAGKTLFADVEALITVVVWVIWGAALSVWSSARGNIFFTAAGILFICWFLAYDLAVKHVLQGEMLALAIAFCGAGLWFSGLAAMRKLPPRRAVADRDRPAEAT